MAFSTQLNLPLFFVHSLMLIGWEIPLIVGPLLVIAFFLVLFWFLGEARNNPMWPTTVLKHNIVLLLISHLSSFGYDGFLRTLVYPHPLLLLFIVTTRVPFILLTMMSSINRLNTSRSIVILSVIILSMVLSSCSQFPQKINLPIVVWLTTSSWSHTHLEFKGGC